MVTVGVTGSHSVFWIVNPEKQHSNFGFKGSSRIGVRYKFQSGE
jgi:hypothetical protein